MRETLKFVRQIAVLCLVFWVCQGFVHLTGLPVPGNVLGIVLLFCLLCFGVIKEEHISQGANFLLKHMVFFFVPIAAGLMDWGNVFYDYGLVLLAAILISSFLPLLATAWLSIVLRKKDDVQCSKQ